MKGYYKCECGKEFDQPNKFNGHKSNCRVHHEAKGTLDRLEKKYRDNRYRGILSGQISKERSERNKQRSFEQWVSEQHLCEKCNRVMTEKFGSGRFCSRSCANSKDHDEQAREKVSKSLLETNKRKYEYNPKICKECGNVLDWEARNKTYCDSCLNKIQLTKKQNHKEVKRQVNRYSHLTTKICKVCNIEFSTVIVSQKYCSKACENKQRSISRLNAIRNGRIVHSSVRSTYKYGTYKNIYCDSSWELAFLVYCIDNNINISRNTLLRFPYIYNNEEHFYLPDFILDDCLVEIKGRKTDEVDIKSKSVPESYNLKVLGWKEIKPYIKYVTSKYGNNFCEVLYDRNYPCYLDKKQ